MTHNSPPFLRGENVGKVLHESYTKWVEHHRACSLCGEHDWYIPGEFLEVKSLPADVKMEVKQDNGETVTRFFCRAPDVNVLCKEGRLLFRAWERSAMNQETVYTRKGMTQV